MNLILNILDTNNINYYNYLNNFLKKNFLNEKKLENYIKNISYNIKNFGDKALIYYSKKFDKLIINNIKDIKINKYELENAYFKLNINDRYLLESIKNRIELFHYEQKNIFYNNWKIIENDGNYMGQKLSLIEKIGFYIPGGKAIYPSSVFMNLCPLLDLKIKKYIISPLSLITNKNNYNLILSTMFLLNVENVYNLGGPHSIFSFYYGTETIPQVNKICGPGNLYVTLAKKFIFGGIGIDMIAGPSEILILCDLNSNPDIIALDMFAQCEHDTFAQSIFISHDKNFFLKLNNSIKKLFSFSYRKSIIKLSIENRSIFIKTKNLDESCNIINYVAPEHLIISFESYNNIFKKLKNFGSIFLNKYTTESFGDYTSGINHILPTNQNSKFSSPLGVYDFFKKSNFLSINKLGFKKLLNITYNLGIKENLFSHSETLKIRLGNENI